MLCDEGAAEQTMLAYDGTPPYEASLLAGWPKYAHDAF
jgi:hypothetical protein